MNGVTQKHTKPFIRVQEWSEQQFTGDMVAYNFLSQFTEYQVKHENTDGQEYTCNI